MLSSLTFLYIANFIDQTYFHLCQLTTLLFSRDVEEQSSKQLNLGKRYLYYVILAAIHFNLFVFSGAGTTTAASTIGDVDKHLILASLPPFLYFFAKSDPFTKLYDVVEQYAIKFVLGILSLILVQFVNSSNIVVGKTTAHDLMLTWKTLDSKSLSAVIKIGALHLIYSSIPMNPLNLLFAPFVKDYTAQLKTALQNKNYNFLLDVTNLPKLLIVLQSAAANGGSSSSDVVIERFTKVVKTVRISFLQFSSFGFFALFPETANLLFHNTGTDCAVGTMINYWSWVGKLILVSLSLLSPDSTDKSYRVDMRQAVYIVMICCLLGTYNPLLVLLITFRPVKLIETIDIKFLYNSLPIYRKDILYCFLVSLASTACSTDHVTDRLLVVIPSMLLLTMYLLLYRSYRLDLLNRASHFILMIIGYYGDWTESREVTKATGINKMTDSCDVPEAPMFDKVNEFKRDHDVIRISKTNDFDALMQAIDE
jgi:hypothetical protein